ncbi:hypothetical protein ACI65C_003973 [Semiaphis heraclei]
MLIRYTGGVINDYRLAIDGIEIRQPRPRAWIAQDKKIKTGLTKLRTNRFSVAEFLGYCKHSTPNFGINRPNEEQQVDDDNKNDIIENIEPIGIENDGDMPNVHFRSQNEEGPIRIENDDEMPNVHFRSPYEEVENMREIIVCVACLNEESNVILRPCNHACLCGACYEGLTRLVCPLCREPIIEIVVILS